MISIDNLYHDDLMLKAGLTIKPSAVLSKYISHYSFSLVRVSNIEKKLTIIPDASGCMVFTFDDTGMDSKVWGTTSSLTIVDKTKKRQTILFMIEFVQGGLKHFSNEYQSDLRDHIVELDIINRELNKTVYALYEKCTSISNFIEKLEIYLAKIVSTKTKVSAFDESILIVKELNGNLAVKDLSGLVNYSERQLNRIYKEHLGMNIKTYMQLVRINKVIIQMKTREINATSIANQYNYYDQAHFTKAFKNVCGVTPKEYQKNMSDFYNEDLKF